MSHRKKYDAFLSFAGVDLPIARALRRLLNVLDLQAYVAEVELPRSGEPLWKPALQQVMRDSQCFLPIVTPSWMSRPWVIYESGAADILGLEKLITRTEGVSRGELDQLPRKDEVQTYDLFDEESLCHLVLAVYTAVHGVERRRDHEERFKPRLVESSEFREVTRLARMRWIFIAGSRPREKGPYHPRIQVKDGGELSGEATLRHVVRDTCEALLDAGFSISSCPVVEDVGGVAFETALQQLSLNDPLDLSRYRIRGQYPIGRVLRELQSRPQERQIVASWLREFREDYIRSNEWILVFGGGHGTREEVEAAQLAKRRVCSIPHFLGAGEELFETIDHGSDFPLGTGTVEWDQSLRDRLVQYLSGTRD